MACDLWDANLVLMNSKSAKWQPFSYFFFLDILFMDFTCSFDFVIAKVSKQFYQFLSALKQRIKIISIVRICLFEDIFLRSFVSYLWYCHEFPSHKMFASANSSAFEAQVRFQIKTNEYFTQSKPFRFSDPIFGAEILSSVTHIWILCHEPWIAFHYFIFCYEEGEIGTRKFINTCSIRMCWVHLAIRLSPFLFLCFPQNAESAIFFHFPSACVAAGESHTFIMIGYFYMRAYCVVDIAIVVHCVVSFT